MRPRVAASYNGPMTTIMETPAAATHTIGEALVDRLMAGDASGAAALLSPDVQFRAVTPKKFFELAGRDDVMAAFDRWFRAGWREALESFAADAVGPRQHMTYRVRWSDEYCRRFVFEQHVYYEADGSGITWVELLCSGHIGVD